MSKSSVSIMAKLGLLIAAFYTMADMFVVTPLLGEISMAYPEASAAKVEMCYGISQLAVVVGSLACGKLCQKISKKTLMIFGGILIAVFGGFGGSVGSINLMLAMRVVEGVGAGLCITLISSIIAELFQDEKEMAKMMGWQAAVGCVCGALCSAFAGKIAVAIGWRQAYYIYFFSILIILLHVFFLPKTPPEQAVTESGEKAKLNGASWVWAVIALMFGILLNAVFLKIPMLLMDTSMGDASVAGFANSLITIGSFVGSMIMAWVFAKTKNLIDFTCWLLLFAGAGGVLIACHMAKSVILLYAFCFIYGLPNGLFFPWLFTKAAMIAAPNTESQTISIVTAFHYTGLFLAAFFYQLVATISGNSSATFAIISMMVITAVLVVVMLLKGVKENQKEAAQ